MSVQTQFGSLRQASNSDCLGVFSTIVLCEIFIYGKCTFQAKAKFEGSMH